MKASAKASARRQLIKARATNRRLHRRVQAAEAPSQAKINSLQREAKMWADSHYHTFMRMMAAHHEMKRVYEMAAEVLGLPYGKYHSVMDSGEKRVDRPDQYGREYREIVALPIVGKKVVDGQPVVDTVRKAFEKLRREPSP